MQTTISDSDPVTPPVQSPQGTPAQSVIRTLGVHKATNHTAQVQRNGWVTVLDICCDVLNRSPLGTGSRVSSQTVARKLRGVLTDHAADRKRLLDLIRQWKQTCDRQTRALPVLKNMSTEEQLNALSGYLDSATGSVGDWRNLPDDKQSELMHNAWFTLTTQFGEKEFQKLDRDSQFDVDFVAWTGCCMHKELNAVKGGVSAMATAWESLGTKPPVVLKNKFEVTTLTTNTQDKTTRGAIKLTSLAGALFNHRDNKRGYHTTIDYYFEVRASV